MAGAVSRSARRALHKSHARRGTPAAAARVAGIDALRGIALAMMFVYHFAFDLRFYRVIAADFENDPFWLGFRALIVASFMTDRKSTRLNSSHVAISYSAFCL